MQRFASLFLGLLLAGASSDVAAGGLTAASEDFLGSSYTTGTQRRPVLAATGDGGFIVVWQDARPGIDGVHVRSRRFDAAGAALGTETQIDTESTLANERPDVAATSAGDFVVVWRRDAPQSARATIVGRKIDAAGAPIGSEFQVNTARELEGGYYLGAPAVARVADSGFVVVWSSGYFAPFNELDSSVFARRFDAGAAALGDDVLVTPSIVPDYHYTRFRGDVAALPNGTSIVTWVDSTNANFARPYAQLLDASGQLLGERKFLVDGGESGVRPVPHAGGEFHVVWRGGDYDYHGTLVSGQVGGRKYDGVAEPLTDELVLAETESAGANPNDHREVAGASVGNERFAVVWASGSASDADRTRIFGRMFDPAGHGLGRERQIDASAEGNQLEPEIALLDAAKLAVAWTSRTVHDGGDVHVRLYDVVPPACGDGNDDGATSVGDALLALQAAVAGAECARCICDADGSGSHTAADALNVLRASVGLATTLDCPFCSESPGAPFHLQADNDCVTGVHMEIPRNALPEDLKLLSCAVDPAFQSSNCVSVLSESDEGLVFDARGCAPGDRTMFSCLAVEGAPESMANAATVHCGCGCEEECGPPQICTAGAGSSDALTCSPPVPVTVTASVPAQVTSIAPAAPSTFTTVQQTATSSSSSTSWCGTCCGLAQSGGLEVQSDVTLTELLVRVQGDANEDCLFCDNGGSIVQHGEARDFCLTGVDAPLRTICEGHGDFFGPYQVLRALGPNFEPLDPAPAVVEPTVVP